MTAGSGLLEVSELRVTYPGAVVLQGVSFRIGPGEVLGLLGESGCGKSTTILAILGLLPAGAAASGSVKFRSRDLLGLSESALGPIRGAQISLVFQEPRAALNPVMRVGKQVAEVIRAHRKWLAAGCKAEAGRVPPL